MYRFASKEDDDFVYEDLTPRDSLKIPAQPTDVFYEFMNRDPNFKKYRNKIT